MKFPLKEIAAIIYSKKFDIYNTMGGVKLYNCVIIVNDNEVCVFKLLNAIVFPMRIPFDLRMACDKG
jgi:hypothetical protein